MTTWLAIVLACGTSPEPVAEPAPPPSPAPVAAPAPAVAKARVNLNTANRAELEAIPGITPKLVHEFEEYRPYVSIRQFRKEIGKYIPEDQVASFEPHVYVPIDANGSDAATLMQIEGLDEAAAEALVAARPFEDASAFHAALAEHVPAPAAEQAMTTLVSGF